MALSRPKTAGRSEGEQKKKNPAAGRWWRTFNLAHRPRQTRTPTESNPLPSLDSPGSLGELEARRGKPYPYTAPALWGGSRSAGGGGREAPQCPFFCWRLVKKKKTAGGRAKRPASTTNKQTKDLQRKSLPGRPAIRARGVFRQADGGGGGEASS